MSATACATHGGHAQYESYCLGLRSGPGANRLSCWELTFGAKFRATQVAVFALGILPIALGALYFTKGPAWLPVIVFVILYGASNGIMTIARGLIPAQVFGRTLRCSERSSGFASRSSLTYFVYASEAGDNAGESPAGRIELFTTENRANCVAVRRGGE